jgi:hypothetical protein
VFLLEVHWIKFFNVLLKICSIINCILRLIVFQTSLEIAKLNGHLISKANDRKSSVLFSSLFGGNPKRVALVMWPILIIC